MKKYIKPEIIYGYWNEHPEFPSDDWAYEVSNKETRLGYWEWVELKIAEREDE
jgi:hypothetical protein